MGRDVEAVRERSRNLRRDVLHERAAARDVEHLYPTTNRKNRQTARPRFVDERQLEFVTSGFGSYSGCQQYLEEFYYGPKSWSDYLSKIGMEAVLDACRRGRSVHND